MTDHLLEKLISYAVYEKADKLNFYIENNTLKASVFLKNSWQNIFETNQIAFDCDLLNRIQKLLSLKTLDWEKRSISAKFLKDDAFNTQLLLEILPKNNEKNNTLSGNNLLKNIIGENFYGLILVLSPSQNLLKNTLYEILNNFENQKKHVISLEREIEKKFETATQIKLSSKNRLSINNVLNKLKNWDADLTIFNEITKDDWSSVLRFSNAGKPTIACLNAQSKAEAIAWLIRQKIDAKELAYALSGLIFVNEDINKNLDFTWTPARPKLFEILNRPRLSMRDLVAI